MAGLSVFIPDLEDVWLEAQVQKHDPGAGTATVKDARKQKQKLDFNSPEMKQLGITSLADLPVQNPGVGKKGIENMAAFDHLHEVRPLTREARNSEGN
jgi:hypothetical protein